MTAESGGLWTGIGGVLKDARDLAESLGAGIALTAFALWVAFKTLMGLAPIVKDYKLKAQKSRQDHERKMEESKRRAIGRRTKK